MRDPIDLNRQGTGFNFEEFPLSRVKVRRGLLSLFPEFQQSWVIRVNSHEEVNVATLGGRVLRYNESTLEPIGVIVSISQCPPDENETKMRVGQTYLLTGLDPAVYVLGCAGGMIVVVI